MERTEITKALAACDSMDTLRDAGAALEPIVGESVRSTSKDGLRTAIDAALDKAEEMLVYVDACNALAPLFGWAKVEPADEVEARESLANASSSDETPSSDDESDDADEGKGGDLETSYKLILVQTHPRRLPAFRNDVVINPSRALLVYPYSPLTLEKARHVVSSFGRLNRDPACSDTPELTLADLG